jgi:hypothetical protein
MGSRTLILFVFVALSATASAQMPTDLIRDNSYELGIDSDTLAELLEFGREGRIELAELVDATALARAQLDELLMVDHPDIDAVMAQTALLGNAETALRQFDVLQLIDMRALLTPEQREAITG